MTMGATTKMSIAICQRQVKFLQTEKYIHCHYCHDKSCIVIVSQKYFMTIIPNSNVARVDNCANLALCTCTYQKLYEVHIHSFYGGCLKSNLLRKNSFMSEQNCYKLLPSLQYQHIIRTVSLL